jgi:predicted MFS family arabinose efflux permease
MAVRRLGEARTILIGLTFTAACLFVMSAAPWAWLATISLTASVVGHALWQPAATAIVSHATDPDRQGAVLGAATASGSLARVIGPVFGGALFSGVGPWAPILFAGAFMLPGAWLGWKAAQALRRDS